MAVVPTTKPQSRVASAIESTSSAWARSAAAPTAETASRKALSYGVTTRRWNAPKLLMARAAAPILSGLRERTSTMRKFSSLGGSFNRSTGAGPPRGIHILREARRTSAKSVACVDWRAEKFAEHSRTIARILWCGSQGTHHEGLSMKFRRLVKFGLLL